jgi:hypothetical protein
MPSSPEAHPVCLSLDAFLSRHRRPSVARGRQSDVRPVAPQRRERLPRTSTAALWAIGCSRASSCGGLNEDNVPHVAGARHGGGAERPAGDTRVEQISPSVSTSAAGGITRRWATADRAAGLLRALEAWYREIGEESSLPTYQWAPPTGSKRC